MRGQKKDAGLQNALVQSEGLHVYKKSAADFNKRRRYQVSGSSP